MREFAVFATAGIFAALIATRVFLPGLAIQSRTPKLTRSLVHSMTRMLASKNRVWLAMPSLIVLMLTLLGLPKLSWNDGIADLNKLDPDLLAEDEAVRERVVRYEQGRLVVAMGADEEAALRVNDQVASALADSQAAGELSGSRSLAVLLPSAATQRSVDGTLRSDAGLWARMQDALAAEGFVAQSFTPFRDSLAAEAPEPLKLAELQASPLEPLVRPFRVTLGEQVGIVSFLHELRDEPALNARLGAIEGARLIDIEQSLTRAYGTYRGRMLWLALLGLVAVLAVVALRHRAIRPTLTAFLPALLAALGTVAILSLAGIELNVLSLVALLMVVSMGVDYGVFLTEAEAGSDALEATHLAVFVAGTSTLLGFGLLAFSDQPPLFSIGLTAGIGVSLCFILAPTLNALFASPSERA